MKRGLKETYKLRGYPGYYIWSPISVVQLNLPVLTRAQRKRVHFCPQHWLLCHLGLY